MEHDEDNLRAARLLSGKPHEPSVLEKEAALEAVLEGTAARPSPRWAWVGGGLVAAAASLVLAFGLRDGGDDGLHARGGGDVRPSASLVCAQGGQPGPCSSSATLHFEVHGVAPSTHVAAFAQGEDGTIVWYFPGPEGHTQPLGRGKDGTLLDRGVSLAANHPPGTYAVFVVFSDEPLSRALLRERLGSDLSSGEGLSVSRLSLVVEAPQP